MHNNTDPSLRPSYCYAYWQSDIPAFADEVHRYKFIQSLAPVTAQIGCQLVSFCLMADSIHLLLHTEAEDRFQHISCAQMICDSGALYLPDTLRKAPNHLIGQDSGWTIHSGTEAKRFCSLIHLLPVRRGCVQDVNHFWFSSWQTYRGIYNWSGLQTHYILESIDHDPGKAIRLFRRYQKQELKKLLEESNCHD